ncbi:MAG: hypothetical protein K2J17_05910 [Paramuribaculum sp.]|nr:hypothetical protein [Paramuribaculum sp.]
MTTTLFQRIKRRIHAEVHYLFFRDYMSRRTIRRHMLKRYSDDAPVTTATEPTVVFMADGYRHHGGLADRLRGIVATYQYCREHSLAFRINFTSPFDLERYLEPASYDWRLRPGELTFNRAQCLPVYLMTTCDFYPERELRYQRRRLGKALSKPFMQAHVNTVFYCADGEFSTLFNELFRPSDAVRRQLDMLREGIAGQYITISTRFLELLGDFTEPKQERLPLPADARQALMDRCVAEIEAIHSANPLPVVLTSDSVSFLEYAASRLPYCRFLPGEVAHIDGTAGHQGDADLKTFVDFYAVKEASRSYLIVGPQMYNSNFSRRAAQAGGHDFDVIRFD